MGSRGIGRKEAVAIPVRWRSTYIATSCNSQTDCDMIHESVLRTVHRSEAGGTRYCPRHLYYVTPHVNSGDIPATILCAHLEVALDQERSDAASRLGGRPSWRAGIGGVRWEAPYSVSRGEVGRELALLIDVASAST